MIILSILVWDSPQYTENLLKSLFDEHQISTHPHKVYILDQGSNAETKDVLEKYADKINLITLKENIGFPKGHNLVYQKAKELGDFEYFCPINSDIRFKEDFWLDKLVEKMQSHEKNAIVGCMGLNIISEGARIGHGRIASKEDEENRLFDFVSGCVFLIKSSVIDQIGFFDEIFTPGYFEDADLNFRIKENGFKQALTKIEFDHHYLGQGTSTTKTKAEELHQKYGDFQEKNRQIFLDRWQGKNFMRVK